MEKKDYLSFLKEFPAQKAEIEKCIACLRETADAISKTHKDCTIANIAASGAGVTSGILTILGLTLTPVTAGGSLILTATGFGLGAAAAATSVSATISELIISSKHSKQSQELIDRCIKSLNKCEESLLAKLVWLLSPDVKELTMEEKLIAELIPKMVGFAGMGIKAKRPVLKVLAMSTGTRVLGAVGAGVLILIDTISIVRRAIHLAEGAQAEKATEIIEAANELEKMLQNLSEQYEQLKRDIGCTLSRQ